MAKIKDSDLPRMAIRKHEALKKSIGDELGQKAWEELVGESW